MASRKIEMKKIQNLQARRVTFSKRHKGLFSKADQYQRITGSEIAVIVFTTGGRPILHGSPSTIERFLASTAAAPMAPATNAIGVNEWADRVERSLNVGDATLEQLIALRTAGEEFKQRVLLGLEDEFVASFLCASSE